MNLIEWIWGPPSAKMERLPDGAIARTGGGGSFIKLGQAGGTGLPIVNETSAQSISAVNACVKLLAGAVSSLPMNIYELNLTNGSSRQLWSDPLWWVLNEQFHPQWPASAGWDHLMRSRLYHGDAFAIIERNGAGAVTSLRPVSKSRVLIYEMDTGRLVYGVMPEARSLDNKVYYYDQDDMIHVPGDGFDGIVSPSVLQYELRNSAASALAAQEMSGRQFANGMMPSLQINVPTEPTPEQVEELRAQINEKYAGPNNAGKPLLMFGGAKAEGLSISARDAQLLESRKFDVEEIARIYGVPPFMIGHNEKTTSWGTGIEAMGAGFVRYTLRRHLHAITNEFNRKLFKSKARFCKFDTSELEQPSFKDYMEALRIGVGRAGERSIVTQNEARSRLDLPPTEGGDETAPLTAPTSRVPIEEEASDE